MIPAVLEPDRPEHFAHSVYSAHWKRLVRLKLAARSDRLMLPALLRFDVALLEQLRFDAMLQERVHPVHKMHTSVCIFASAAAELKAGIHSCAEN